MLAARSSGPTTKVDAVQVPSTGCDRCGGAGAGSLTRDVGALSPACAKARSNVRRTSAAAPAEGVGAAVAVRSGVPAFSALTAGYFRDSPCA